MDRTRLTNISLGSQQNREEEADKNINENLLISVSADLLYEGMVVQDDIYDASGDRKLINSGSTLDELQIERIKRLNSGSNTIYVTGRTQNAMMSKRPNNVVIEVRHEIENSTGYTKNKDEAFECLQEIAGKKNVTMESLAEISNNLTDHLEATPQDVVLLLINALAPANEYLQRHCLNVGILNGLVGRWMGMPDRDIDNLVLIGLLHDTGMIKIPQKIPDAPRKLTVTEYEVIKTHVNHTYDLLSELPEDIRIAACSHHERLNGTGYNYKLKNDDIILNARITAVSDTYDAVVSQRAFKEPQSPFNALALLKELSNTELDRKIVNAFIENIPKDLVGKPVMMSDGTIGIVREYDPDDIGYPMVELGGRTVKTNEKLFCKSIFSDD